MRYAVRCPLNFNSRTRAQTTMRGSIKYLNFLFLLLALPVATQAASINGWVGYADVYPLDTGVDGTVEAISIREGERVLEGTLLLKLKDGALQAALAAATADQQFAAAQKAP